MGRSSKIFWLYFITLQLFIYDGETKLVQQQISDPLPMDKGYLTITNKDYPGIITLTFNYVPCEHCDFSPLAGPLPMHSNSTITIDTRFPYDIRVDGSDGKNNISCRINSHRFLEHASYVLEVTQGSDNSGSCSITQTGPSSYYWTPIIVGNVLLLAFVIVIQAAHRLYESTYFNQILTNIGHGRRNPRGATPQLMPSPVTVRSMPPKSVDNQIIDDAERSVNTSSELPLVGSTRLSNNTVRIAKVLPKRLRGLDTFRGFSLMVMIFVNYGGGGYWFFDHSIWNGLTLADLVFPWFVWMMGVSVVLSQRSLRMKNIKKRFIFVKICRRTAILFILGLILQGGGGRLSTIRILGVLQRLALCYFFTATIVLFLEGPDDGPLSSEWPIGDDVDQSIRDELMNTVFHYWAQWTCILLIVLAWILVTFIPKLPGCPRGYVGPGGKHQHGQYSNCTGGVAGFLDRKILGPSHLYNSPTCKEMYDTKMAYDPEGLLGILTGIFLCYLGAQAGHTFAHSTRTRRVCAQWIVTGLICGTIGLIISKGGQSESWVPINKNLWSLSFILILASLAFFILTILYLTVDVYKFFTGEPWLWLGMNSIVLYVGHEVCSQSFPVQFEVDETHAKRLALHAYGVTFWMIVAGVMYFKKVFIAI